MAYVLNLTLKKDVFESIVNGTGDDILIEKTDWWTKRLMDKATNEFKEFRIVRISSGSADKFDFPIWSIRLDGDNFVITVAREVSKDTPEPEVEVERQIEIGHPIVTPKVVNPIIVNRENEKPVTDIKTDVKVLLNEFCKRDNVVIVHFNDVRICPNGRILGSDKRIKVNTDTEIRFEFHTEEIVNYKYAKESDFVNAIKCLLESISKNSYVFLKKNACGFKKITSGEDVLVLTFASVKTYLFKK